MTQDWLNSFILVVYTVHILVNFKLYIKTVKNVFPDMADIVIYWA